MFDGVRSAECGVRGEEHPPFRTPHSAFRIRDGAWLDMLLCCAVAVLVYVNSIWSFFPPGEPHGFVYDDYPLVIEQPAIRSLSPGNIVHIFAGPLRGAYRPLRVISYALDFCIWGLNPVGYHVTNILLHAANCVLVYLIVCVLMGKRNAALLAALLFAVHPICTESVACIAGRKDLLGALLVLASLCLYIRATNSARLVKQMRNAECRMPNGNSECSSLRTPHSAIRIRNGAYVLSLLLFTIALFAKEVMVGFLSVFMAYEFCFSRKGWLGHIIRRQVPFAAVGVAFVALWYSLSHGYGTLKVHYGLAFALKGFGCYLRLMFLPVRLSVDYNALAFPKGLLDWAVLVSILLLIFSAVIAIGSLRRNPWLTFGIIWFFAALLPLSNVIVPIGARLSERYLYVPAIGWCMAIGGLLAGLIDAGARSGERARRFALSLAAILIVLLAIGTVYRNEVWRSHRTLWQDAIRKAPDSWGAQKGCGEIYSVFLKPSLKEWHRLAMPHFLRSAATWPNALMNLADIAILRGRLDQAEEYAALHTRSQPAEGYAWASLGKVHARQRKWAKAIEAYEKAISLSPWEGYYYWDLGLVYLQSNDPDSALREFDKAVEVGPHLREKIGGDIGAACLTKGLYREAIPHLKRARQADPTNIKIADCLAYACERSGEPGGLADALAVYATMMNECPESRSSLELRVRFLRLKLALKSEPPTADLLKQLGILAGTLDRPEEAIQYLKQAEQLAPNDAKIKCCLAAAYAADGKPKEAEGCLTQALALDPKEPLAWFGLAALRAEQKQADEALNCLRKAIEAGGLPFQRLARQHPSFQSLREDDEFKKMTEGPDTPAAP